MNSLIKKRMKKVTNCFAAGLTALNTSQKLKLHRNTVNKYYRLIREAIVQYQNEQYNIYAKRSRAERYYIGWNKNKGLCLGHEPGSIVYEAFVHNERVYIESFKETTRQNIVDAGEAAAYGNGNDYYKGLKQLDIEAVSDNIDESTIRNFYTYAKGRLTRFYGVKPKYTYLYIKELEFRFNNRNKNISKLVWRVVTQTPSPDEQQQVHKAQAVEGNQD